MSPKISIVTTTLNADAFLERCIRSIVDQGYPNLEYIVFDAGSTDRTIEIVESFSDAITTFRVVPGIGLYAGLQHGFDLSSGEIMGWLNADDILHPGSLETIAAVFEQHAQVNWITGRTCLIDGRDRIFSVPPHRYRSRRRFLLGDRAWIQQESTFWRRPLWQRVGGLRTELHYAGDFDLWFRYYQYDRLYLVDCLIGAFRIHDPYQLSHRHAAEYDSEVEAIRSSYWNGCQSSNYKLLKRAAPLDKLIKIWSRRNPDACEKCLTFLNMNHIIGFAPLLRLNPHTGRFTRSPRK